MHEIDISKLDLIIDDIKLLLKLQVSYAILKLHCTLLTFKSIDFFDCAKYNCVCFQNPCFQRTKLFSCLLVSKPGKSVE